MSHSFVFIYFYFHLSYVTRDRILKHLYFLYVGMLIDLFPSFINMIVSTHNHTKSDAKRISIKIYIKTLKQIHMPTKAQSQYSRHTCFTDAASNS